MTFKAHTHTHTHTQSTLYVGFICHDHFEPCQKFSEVMILVLKSHLWEAEQLNTSPSPPPPVVLFNEMSSKAHLHVVGMLRFVSLDILQSSFSNVYHPQGSCWTTLGLRKIVLLVKCINQSVPVGQHLV